MTATLFYWPSDDPRRQGQIAQLHGQLKGLPKPVRLVSRPPSNAPQNLLPGPAWILVGPEAEGHLEPFLRPWNQADPRIHFLLQDPEHGAHIPEVWRGRPIHLLNSPAAFHILLSSLPESAALVPATSPPPTFTPVEENEQGLQLNLPSPKVMAGIGVLLVVIIVFKSIPEPEEVPSLSYAVEPPAGWKGDLQPLGWVESRPLSKWFTQSEISVHHYQECVEARLCQPLTHGDEEGCNHPFPDRQDHPSNCVLWEEAENFCRQRGGRLPTYQEWQAEAAPTPKHLYPWGEATPDCSLAAMYDGEKAGCGAGTTSPICSHRSGNSRSGLCDMAGNVMEWTQEGRLVSHSIFWTGGVDLAVYYNKAPVGISVRVLQPNAPPIAKPGVQPAAEVLVPISVIGFRCLSDLAPR